MAISFQRRTVPIPLRGPCLGLASSCGAALYCGPKVSRKVSAAPAANAVMARLRKVIEQGFMASFLQLCPYCPSGREETRNFCRNKYVRTPAGRRTELSQRDNCHHFEAS